jgi:hypothetical protein
VEQELLTLPEYLCSPTVVSCWGSCYSIFSLMCMFCRSLFVLFLLAIVLSVLIRFTDSDYSPLVSSNSSSYRRNTFVVNSGQGFSNTRNFEYRCSFCTFWDWSFWINDMHSFSQFRKGMQLLIFSLCFFSGLVSVKCLLFLLKGQINCKRFTDSDYSFGIFKLFLHLLMMPQDLISEIVHVSVFIKNSFNKN